MIAALLAATFWLPLQRSDAVIGFGAKDLVFGAGVLEREKEHFPMGALASVPIALEVLHRIDEGTLLASDEELVERMVRLGDTTATSRLLDLVGAAAVNQRMAVLGAPEIDLDRGTATPAAMEDLFISIVRHEDGLSDASHDKLMRWMEASTGASRIKAGLPSGVTLAHFEGTMSGATSDAVIINGVSVMVIFTKDAKSSREDVERDIAAVTRVVSDWLDGPSEISGLAWPLPPQTSDAVIGVWAKEESGGWCEREDEAFPMGGLARVPIALEVLHRIDQGTLRANQEEMLEQMVRLGNTAAADRLLRLVGAAAVNRRMAALGAPEIRLDLGTATPEAMERLFISIVRHDDGLSDASRDKLMRWMETSTGASRIKAGLPSGVKLAHVEGTMSGATSDAVIIDGVSVMVIFTKDAKSARQDVERDIAAVTSHVWYVMSYVRRWRALTAPPHRSTAAGWRGTRRRRSSLPRRSRSAA
jgi:beta-lactamase class A